MAADDILTGLRARPSRTGGSDGERRAALWLAEELRRGAGGRGQVRIETFWCRPDWALAAAWHVALGLAGSLVSVGSPRVGGALLLAAILATIADVLTGVSPGRWLTPLRASQNVIWRLPHADPPPPVTLILTAGLDTPRGGILHRPAALRAAARLRAIAGAWTPGWAGWLVLALVAVLATAIARAGGDHGAGVGIVQLGPTVALVLALALLLEQATAGPGGPALTDAAGVAGAVTLARALAAAPPATARVELVIQGAAGTGALGLRHHLRRRRRTLRPSSAVVLGITGGETEPVRWWSSDGPLVPLRPLGSMRRLAARQPGLRPFAGRGTSPAYPALVRRIPALTLGDAPPPAIVRAGLALIDAVDAEIAARRTAGRS